MITFMVFLDSDDGITPTQGELEEALRDAGLDGRVMTINGEDEED